MRLGFVPAHYSIKIKSQAEKILIFATYILNASFPMNEIIIYQSDDASLRFEVLLEDDTVWLTQSQMVDLFQSTKQNISLHINNIYKEKELDHKSTVKESLTVRQEGKRTVKRTIKYYNLDVIISVGYRVKSQQGTRFRIWANKVLKDYLLRGYAINNRFERIEDEVHHLKQKLTEFDFQIKAGLPPREGIFYNGQIFDAWVFVSKLIKNAKKSIILVDNYIDESVLLILAKRNPKVPAVIYTGKISNQIRLDLQKHNQQYAAIEIKSYKKSHDRFLIIDNQQVCHIGASLKDLGKKLFAFSRMEMNAGELLARLEDIE